MSGQMLYLWDATDYGIPTNMDEVFKTFNQLIEKPERPSSAMLAFAQRIQDIIRFGSNTDEELRRLYGNFVDKVKQHPFALLAVELPYNNYLPVMRMIVETATALQLVAYDDQQGLVFLPSGDIFPESRAEIWLGALAHLDSNKDFPKNVKAFEAHVKPMLEDMMAKHGFIKKHIPVRQYDSKTGTIVEVQTPIYSKSIPIGECYVSLSYAKGRYGYGIPASLHIKYDPVDVIYNRFGFVNTDSYSTFHIQLLIDLLLEKEMPNKSFEMNSHQDILDRLTLMEKTIFPFFSTLHDLKSLDNLVNGNVNTRFTSAMQGRGISAPRCLILARLANNPHFEELAVALATPRFPGANRAAITTEWPKLVQYLREDINPATCCQQFAQLQKEEQRLELARLNALQLQYNPQTSDELMSLASQFYDAKTNLIWQQCCVGQQWVDGKVIGSPQLLSWDEVQKKLAQESDKGWRLPTYEELKNLIITTRIGYITKEGFDFYEIQTRMFSDHWISPLEDICTISVRNIENPTIYDAPSINTIKNNKNLKGVLRLVKSAS